MKNIKLLFLFILFVILSFSFKRNIFATEQSFSDSFDSLENWDFISSSIGDTGSWRVENGVLVGSIGKTGSSYLFSKKHDFGSNIKFNFEATSISGIDEEVLFGVSEDRSNFYVLNTRVSDYRWADSNTNRVILWRYINGQYLPLGSVNVFNDFGINLSKNNKYLFSVVVENNEIKININGILVLTVLDENILSGGIGFWNWGGEFDKENTTNKYNNLEVNYSSESIPTETPTPTPIETPTPTPTEIPTPTNIPTPTPVPKKKIFILPGLGASWNSQAIVYNQQVNDNAWKMTPFVNNYDGLIEVLEKNGLVRDEDFFVWNYDWRKSISEIENKFNSFLESKSIGENDEIYLVGHSLGGVVARLWGQDHKDDQRLESVITLGSPHLGSLDSYSVWNGGKVVDSKGISSVVFQILLNLQNKGLIPNLAKTRSYAPVVKDLLPTSENYVLKNGRYLSQNRLETRNDFLMSKNNEVNKISDKLKLSVGIGFSTPNLIKLGERTTTDKILGLWPDGKLIGYSYSVGDGTVLRNSASFGSTNLLELNSNHGEIVNNSLDFVMSNLGLENKSINSIYNDNFSDSLVVFVGSPATVSVKCGNDTYMENDGFVVIKNKKYNECDLNLNPTDNGVVHLVMGNTNNSDWNYIEKSVTLNNFEKVFVDFNKGDIKIDKRNKDFLISWIKSDLKLLGLDKAIKFLDKGNFKQVINMVFAYRWKTREMIISQRILDNLFILGSINGPNKRFYNYNWMYMYWNFLGKIMHKNYLSIMSFNKFGEIVDFSKNKNYPNEEIIKSLSDGYNSEILGN